MAMSLKKIGAIAVGGAMVASALASGVMAATTIGDVAGFMKNAVKDGQPNVEIVVGSGAATMDVVSAADIAAKIGSMCYKTGAVEDGKAVINAKVSQETETYDLVNGSNVILATPDKDNALSKVDGETVNPNFKKELNVLMKIKNAMPEEYYGYKDYDAVEEIYANVTANLTTNETSIPKGKLAYLSVLTDDNGNSLKVLKPGVRLPFLGSEKVYVKYDDKKIILGDLAYSGIISEGESVAIGDGYEVKVAAMYSSTPLEAEIQILKDGKVIKEDRLKLNESNPDDLITDDNKVAVLGFKGLKNIGETKGYAEVIVVKDLMELEAGEEYMDKWEIRWVKNDSTFQKGDVDDTVAGIALVYTNDDGVKSDVLEDKDDTFDIKPYPGLYLKRTTAKEENPELRIGAELSKEEELSVGQSVSIFNADIKLKDIKADAQQAVPVTAPIAKLDTEVSLDTAEKNLILVGGPVANKLTKELVDMGKVNITNDSPATLQVVEGVANGHDVLVVAGGDRNKTREAALELIKEF
ncbi:S-layer protein [Methanotorris igneus]|uniref:S-layer protein n=1 Tax=Methanotorris igneus (strain DSM 5666 / JCM 11834 / Kol 5) TaxID=880724 RepID=F6BC80_METIK|nr:S-layer protein [Methanotorris igneus]AEF97286.1 S-layer protein [Methanotorris igneus Kol 5]